MWKVAEDDVQFEETPFSKESFQFELLYFYSQ